MARFTPQFGDIDGNGTDDLITCSNCCDCYDLYWFPSTAERPISQRIKSQIRFEPEDDPGFVKRVSYPFVVDWDDDGDADIVVCNYHGQQVVGESDQAPKYMTTHQFFLSKTEASQSVGKGELSTNHAADQNWFFEKLNLQIDGLHTSRFAFGDYDGDGRIDLLQSRFAKHENGEGTLSAIFFRRNTTKAGAPEFDSPVRVFEAPQGWQINSITMIDLDDDAQQEFVCGAFEEKPQDPDKRWIVDSEIWLLDRD